MSRSDQAEFRNKLNEFSDRLRRRAQEFRSKGEFSDTHETLLDEIQKRNDALTAKVSEAERSGTAWDLIKAEMARDLSSLYDDMLEIEERLDTSSAKK